MAYNLNLTIKKIYAFNTSTICYTVLFDCSNKHSIQYINTNNSSIYKHFKCDKNKSLKKVFTNILNLIELNETQYLTTFFKVNSTFFHSQERKYFINSHSNFNR